MKKMKYKISSRTTILLGRNNIPKAESAIIELIKNTYDADATLCHICFDIENDQIIILDNGSGMTQEIIENHWMMIGTDNKKYEYKSKKNRIKSGEKGIGRFSLDRLGSICEMYTKNEKSNNMIHWKTDWSLFEEEGKTLDDMEADFEFLNVDYKDVIPKEIYDKIIETGINIDFQTGTLLKIKKLRDEWKQSEIEKLIQSISFLIPLNDILEYHLFFQKKMSGDLIIIENDFKEEYDYKLITKFDGEKFKVVLKRNEYDLEIIPKEVFELDRFKTEKYTYNDFKKGEIEDEYTIDELMGYSDDEVRNKIMKIGPFEFSYTFMKLATDEASKQKFFYKELGKNRKEWMERNAGIKIYRDNFVVRPYGDRKSGLFDWLNLDSRQSKNPISVGGKTERWIPRNEQGVGVLKISRVENKAIVDLSNREGIIENEEFEFLKILLIKLIEIFAKDRSYIGRTFSIYNDIISESETLKEEAKILAKEILKNSLKEGTSKGKQNLMHLKNNTQNLNDENDKDKVTLAKALKLADEEKEELISEMKILRSLSTNGLLTTTIVHDLKGVESLLVSRIDALKKIMKIENKEIGENLRDKHLESLKDGDAFLKAWISVITNHVRKDRRKMKKKSLFSVIEDVVKMLFSILERKEIKITLEKEGEDASKRIFISDFEAIIYNLIMNSIESLEKKCQSNTREIKIKIKVIENEDKREFVIEYEDNGMGLDPSIKVPNEIFKYGITTKRDKDRNEIGTGLGMYIVSSTINEYKGDYKLTKIKDGFGIMLKIPV